MCIALGSKVDSEDIAEVVPGFVSTNQSALEGLLTKTMLDQYNLMYIPRDSRLLRAFFAVALRRVAPIYQ
jgi:hypothetical protein